MFWKCRTEALIGPHHRGKNGRAGAGTCPRGSSRLRNGTGDRERSDSAMTILTGSNLH